MCNNCSNNSCGNACPSSCKPTGCFTVCTVDSCDGSVSGCGAGCGADQDYCSDQFGTSGCYNKCDRDEFWPIFARPRCLSCRRLYNGKYSGVCC
ncbi:MAG: hypothetical protein LBC56_03985 [Oscillospiraceae bacterium]|nr:hypothetical protein [Oscillospiraceae bacterium]